MSELEKIPKDFLQSDQTLISHCKLCNTSLLEGETTYLLEKAVKVFPEIDAKEVIFEYAICWDCAQNARKKISDESKRAIESFLQSEEIQRNLMSSYEHALFSNKSTLDFCMITGKERSKVKEYQIIAHCKGYFLSKGTQAFMISDEGLEILSNLLSAESKDELENFKDTHFGVPPEFEKILNPSDLLLI